MTSPDRPPAAPATSDAGGPGGHSPYPAGEALKAAPAWRREPYRVLFPIGVLLAWAGVGHWLLLATLKVGTYSSVFHSIVQVQGFMMCFAVGFLFTAIPRRTGTAPPAGWQVAFGALAPIATTVAAWAEELALSQTFWVLLVAVMVEFAVRRFRSATARRRPPNSFMWVPLAFLMGVVGAVLTGVGGALKDTHWHLHELGKALILQGMMVGLVLGVGGMVIPLLTCGDAPPDGAATRRDHLIRAAHLLAALLLVGTFALEAYGEPRLGLALRAGLVLVVLLAGARIYRTPRVPGWHRWLVWISAWMIPLGFGLAAAGFPAHKQAGLHVVFVGGFALMALAVGLHVTLAHGGYTALVRGRLWQVPALGVLLLGALAARGLMSLDPTHLWTWMGIASAGFLLSTVVWLSLVLPRLRDNPASEAS